MSQKTETLFADRYLVTHTVEMSQDGERLDSFLKTHYRKRSRETLKRAISDGRISIVRDQGSHYSLGKIKASTQLLCGDVVQVLTEKKPEPRVNFQYKVLFEDSHLFVIHKPANLPVHPAGRFFFHTLLVHLKTEGFTIPLRAERDYYLVHRIDRETSGVLLLTKTREMAADLVAQFAQRKTQKKYLALIHGWPLEDDFEVDAPIGKAINSKIRLKMGVCSPEEGGLPASTRFQVLKRFSRNHFGRLQKFALVECFPKTGRQHQIRVHLAHLSHPIVGDKLYSLEDHEALRFFTDNRPEVFDSQVSPSSLTAELEDKLILPRQALHAYSLGFKHPLTQEWMEFQAPFDEDLAQFMDSLSEAGLEQSPFASLPPKPPLLTPPWASPNGEL